MSAMLTSYARSLPRLLQCRCWARLPIQLFHVMVAAQRRSRERCQLTEMDAAQLKDIGLTEADCMSELRKLVWRR